jgi:hypothetical protein
MAGDAEAFKALIAEVRKDLPEFTKEPEFRTAYTKAEEYAKKTIARPMATDFGKAVIFRHEYEQALDAFREDRLVAAIEAAERARQKATDEASRTRVADLAGNGIEAAILTTNSSESDRGRRAEIRTALDKGQPWIAAPRWQRLDAQLRAIESPTR